MNKIAVVLGMLSLIAAPASATLIGDTIDARWQFAPTGFDITDTLLVGPGIETTSWAGGSRELDIEASSISIDFGTSTSGIGTGVRWTFSDLDWVGTPGSIVDVAVSTNYIDWNDSFVTFGSDWIDVEFGNDVDLDGTNDFFVISIDTSHAPIPEPMTLSLLGMGIAGLVARRKLLA